jgi:AcrR family transcriptional regulator
MPRTGPGARPSRNRPAEPAANHLRSTRTKGVVRHHESEGVLVRLLSRAHERCPPRRCYTVPWPDGDEAYVAARVPTVFCSVTYRAATETFVLLGPERDGVTTNDGDAQGRAGRERLLDVAEELFDAHGIDGVSARAVVATAGMRNTGAVNYHFGTRLGLVRAVLERRRDHIELVRNAMLDALEATGPVAPRNALYAALRPLIDLLADPAGRRHLRLLQQAWFHPEFTAEANVRFATGIARAAVHLAPLLEPLPADRRLHRARTMLLLAVTAIAEQARLLELDPPPRPVLDTEQFTQDLLDVLLAGFTA